MDAVAEPSLLSTTMLSSARPYRLGLDLGSNSIGWFVVWLERDDAESRWRPVGLGPGGVRIFPDGRDPQSGTSNAVDRRQAKSMRVRRDRFVERQKALVETLVRYGLMPEDKDERKALEKLDPYELRAKALEGPLPAHHVGRALFHLNQRRGFLSNKKVERTRKGKPDETGTIKQGEDNLLKNMDKAGARTLGEFLWSRHRQRLDVRARGKSSGSKLTYDFYPTRALVRAEFEAIWSSQTAYHHSMSVTAHNEIAHVLFFQRALKPPTIGKCTISPAKASREIEPDGYRCTWSHPLAQRFRIYQDVRNLEVVETGHEPVGLSKEQGDRIAMALMTTGKLNFDRIRSLLGLPREARFNLEKDKRNTINGNALYERFAKKDRFGKRWQTLDLDTQAKVIQRLEEIENQDDEEDCVSWLKGQFALDSETANRIVRTPLPEGHCRLGLRAISQILPHLEAGYRYHEAVKRANPAWDHAKLPTGELSMTGNLPYYGERLQDDLVGSSDPLDKPEIRYGRFPNPTVHIGLNQLRKVVNELIGALGAPPTQIVVEFTRAFKLTPEKKRELEREQLENQRRNDQFRARIVEHGQEPNQRNLTKMKLWQELAGDAIERKCPYTGEQISIRRLLSEEVDIDHIIPFSISYDDSMANKVVCMREANRAKKKMTPFQAFGGSPMIGRYHYDWSEIAARANSLPNGKRWRFAPDALEQMEARGGFLNRQLNETGWLARAAKKYVAAITNPNEIWVLPGRMTAMIRAKWNLNKLLPDAEYKGVSERISSFQSATEALEFSGVKNRADHRHHAIDALVAAVTDRALIQEIASLYDEERQKITPPKPWDSLWDDLEIALKTLVVSHKPDHGPEGQLHEDTAYGFRKGENEGDTDDTGKALGNLVYRKPLVALNDNEIERIRDRRLRDKVREHVFNLRRESTNMTLADALHHFAEEVKAKKVPGLVDGISRVRILKPEKPDYLVPVANGSGVAYKAYSAGENHCVEIYETPDGKWQGEAIRRFDANQNGYRPRWRAEVPDARLVMRVHKGDTLRLEVDGETKIMVVHRLDASNNRFKLAAHNETGNLDRRHAMGNDIDPFRWLMASYSTLKKANAARVRVDPIGRVWNLREKDA